jgi:hypothetical protein
MKDNKLYSKLVMSGAFIERIELHLPPRRGGRRFTFEELENRRKIKALYNSGLESPDPEKTAPSVNRSRSRLRRLIYANAGKWKDRNGHLIPAKFLTLTFQENIQDLKTANKYLTEFIKKLNYHFENLLAQPLKYVCVPEFQERGAIHYHLVLFNFPFINRIGLAKLREYWGGYRIHLKAIRSDIDVTNIIGYVTKYITKQSSDGRFFGNKRYFASRDIEKPLVMNNKILENDIAIELIRWRIQGFEKYKTVFDVPFCGRVSYWTYYLGDGKTVESLPLDPYARKQIEIAKNS